MITREIVVPNKAGLHTRPASMLVQKAGNFDADFYIQKGNYEINGKSIIGVMTLAAEQGTTLSLIFEGEDEEEAADAIVELFNNGFGEES